MLSLLFLMVVSLNFFISISDVEPHVLSRSIVTLNRNNQVVGSAKLPEGSFFSQTQSPTTLPSVENPYQQVCQTLQAPFPVSRAEFGFSQNLSGGGRKPTLLCYNDSFHLKAYCAESNSITVARKNQSVGQLFVTPRDPTDNSLGPGTWTAVTNYSYVIEFERKRPDDVVMELEVSLPKDNYLGEPELREGRIYLAKYNSNRDGWVVDIEHSRYDNIRSLTTLSSLKTPEGEYRLIAYNPSGFRSLFLDFFEGVVGEEDHTFKVIGSVKEKSSDQALMPLQIAAWQDGTRVLIRSPNPINISLGLTNPTLESVPAGYTLATTRGYILRSTGSSTGAQLSLLLPYISRQLNSKNITINDLYGARREENSTSQFSVITRTVPVGSSSVLTKGPIINLPGEYTLLAKLPESKGKEIPKTEVLPTIISSSTNRLDFNYHNDFFLKTINLIIIIFWRMSFAGL